MDPYCIAKTSIANEFTNFDVHLPYLVLSLASFNFFRYDVDPKHFKEHLLLYFIFYFCFMFRWSSKL
jgi:hypothetical protein